MDRSAHREELAALGGLLRARREAAGLLQVDVANRVGVPQSYVSKYESGERRLDLVELREVCLAIGIGLGELSVEFDGLLR